MPKARRRKPHNPAKAHDRRSGDLLRNAEVATVEVDNPLGLPHYQEKSSIADMIL